MDFEQLAPQLDTGDIILFGGTSQISTIIDSMTYSKYSHVGMVIRAPGSSGTDGLSLWQSFTDGVDIFPLRGFLVDYVNFEPGSAISARLLAVTRTPEMLQALNDFIPKVSGLPFPGFGQWIVSYMSGCLGVQGPQDSYYCSALVGQTYIAMGLLKNWPLATVYTPGRFAEDTYDLQLQLGASLGAEIPVTTGHPSPRRA